MHTAAKVHAVGASTAELVEMSTIDRALAIAAVYVSQRHSPNGSRTQAGDPGSSIHANAMASSYGGPFDGLTRDQLQLVLKERGLTQRGTRAECIQRLIGTGSKFMAKAKVRVRKQNQTQNAKPLGRRQIKNTSAKALTYTQLCSVALYALGDCTDLQDIYDWLAHNHPRSILKSKSWKSSVRSALVSHKEFIKTGVPREYSLTQRCKEDMGGQASS